MSSAEPLAAGTGGVLTEQPASGGFPRYELAEWSEAHGLVAGITSADADLGLWTRRPVGDVMAAWRRFRESHAAFEATVLAHQVHGAAVLRHDAPAGWQIHDGADGHVTARRGVLLAVTVADCIPVYLAAPAHGVVALLHAGWRGTAAGILTRGAEIVMETAACGPGGLVAHLGVGICGGCYEVGADVVRACGGEADGEGPWHVDLRYRLAAEAAARGIEARRSPARAGAPSTTRAGSTATAPAATAPAAWWPISGGQRAERSGAVANRRCGTGFSGRRPIDGGRTPR